MLSRTMRSYTHEDCSGGIKQTLSEQTTKFSREWAMPSGDTFTSVPIRKFVARYLAKSKISVDPFSRNSDLCTHTNDLDPETQAAHHMDAIDFVNFLIEKNVHADLLIIDPPYSPRQVSELYRKLDKTVTKEDTQGSYWRKLKDACLPLLTADATILWFGWNTSGMGKERGFEIVEIMLVNHGGSHANDTLCMAEKRSTTTLEVFRV
jgi:hypothetical protein